MVNLIEYIKTIGENYGIEDPDFMIKISEFLVGNNWFGCKPIIHNNCILLDEESAENIWQSVNTFCEYYDSDDEMRIKYLLENMQENLPKTASFLKRYFNKVKLEKEAEHHLTDFLLKFLVGEIDESTDKEIEDLMNSGFDELPKVYGDILADFINWIQKNTKTIYKNLYYMNNYSDKTEQFSAYEPNFYLKILYHLYNEDYINDNDMYMHAAESKNYVDTWLFLALHFLCSVRNTDLIRLPHPRLDNDPQIILEQIKNDTFSDESAKHTLYTILWELDAMMPNPNKTQGTQGIGAIKLDVPTSVEGHIGKLFAAAEAHFQIACEDKDKPLVRIIRTYEQISRYMGDEIGDLFLEANFNSISANKAYMQITYILTDDIIGINDEFRVKGYMMAALARSHKGTYGDFARTTSNYLKDAKMSGYSPEFVAKELFERGVLSLIPSMLLKTIIKDKYNDLSVENQTKLVKELNLIPIEVEKIVSIVQNSMSRSLEIVNKIYEDNSEENIISILHRIGNGEAVSKSSSCMCLITAMGKMCPYLENQNCPCCEYEISTKSTMFLMAQEVKRLRDIFLTSEDELEKKRSKEIATNVVIPCIENIIIATENIYGEAAAVLLQNIIAEV